MWVGKSECRRLYEHDPNLMFACAAPYGEPLILLVRLLPREKVGSDDINNRIAHFTIVDVPNFLHLQNKDGDRASAKDLKGKVPTLAGWPGQTFGNDAVARGDYVDWLIYKSRPKKVLNIERKEAIRAAGREQDRAVKDAAAEMTDYKNFLQKQSAPNTKILTKEDYKEHMASPLGQMIDRIQNNDTVLSNEHRYLKDNGLS